MRKIEFNELSQPQRNLIANPAFRYTSSNTLIATNYLPYSSFDINSGLITTRTNMCINPAFEAPGAMYTLRTNLCSNPNAELDTSWWVANAAVLSRDTAWADTGSASFKLVPSGGGAASDMRTGAVNSFPFGMSAGKTYTLSATCYMASALTGTLDGRSRRVRIYYSTDGATWSTYVDGTQAPNTPGSFRSSATISIPSNATGALVMLGMGSNTTTDALWWDSILLEESTFAGSYFDGNTGDTDYTLSWSGTANSSSSLAKVPGTTNWNPRWYGNSGGSGGVYLTKSGINGYALRKLWRTANTGAALDTGINTPNTAVTPGTTYTATISMRPNISASATTLTPFVVWYDSGGATLGNTSTTSGVIAPAGVWTKASVVATAPANAATAAFVFGPYSGGGQTAAPMAAGDSLDFDQCLIEQSSVVGTYFDGSTAPNNLADPSPTALQGTTLTTGITYAGSTGWNRVSVATGSGSPVMRQYVALSKLVNGQTYTSTVTVANDQPYDQQVSLDFCDQGYTNFTIAAGETRRITMSASKSSYDSVYRFSDLQVVQSSTEGRSLLFKDWVIEAGTTSTDIEHSYAWSGTAHSSASYQKAPQPTGWTANGGTVFAQSKTNMAGGTVASAEVSTKGVNGDGFWPGNDFNIVGQKDYTYSAWVKVTDTSTPITMGFRWKGTSGTFTDTNINMAGLQVGKWVRVSATATSPSGATSLQMLTRVYSAHTPFTFWVTGISVTDSSSDIGYFDGNTTASGDFSYAWSGNGVANVNQSIKRANAIPNLMAARNGSYQSSKLLNYRSTEGGKGFARWVSPANSGTSGWRIAGVSGPGFAWERLKAGGVYTLLMRYRASGWPANSVMYQSIRWGSATNVVSPNGDPLSLNATGWQEYRRTFVAQLSGDSNQTIYLSLPAIPSTTTDSILDISEIMLVEGAWSGDYIDGTLTEAKWDGVPNNSLSVGYQQSFKGIAGTPILDYSTAGTYTLDDSFGVAEARTFYSVIDELAFPNGTINSVVTYGISGLSDASIANSTIIERIQGTPSAPGLLIRRTGGGGPYPTGTKISRNVICWGIATDGTLFGCINNGTFITDIQTMAVPHQQIRIEPDSTYHLHLRTIGYRGMHNAATRTAMMRYLGNKYGAPVA